MKTAHRRSRIIGACVALLGLASLQPSTVSVAEGASNLDRLVVLVRSPVDRAHVREVVERGGGHVLDDLTANSMLVVRGPASLRASLTSTSGVRAVAQDRIERLIPPDALSRGNGEASPRGNGRTTRTPGQAGALPGLPPDLGARFPFDPALWYPGLLWNVLRIDALPAWFITSNAPGVRVGVADTGVDFTHVDLRSQVDQVVDFTSAEDPPICKTFFPNPIDPNQPGIGDAELAATYGGPPQTDWNGHGTALASTIGAAANGVGVVGVAPRVRIVSLKIAQWCGATDTSTILAAIAFAADHGIPIVNLSLGGYLDLRNPDDAVLWSAFVEAIADARARGTAIVTASGNEHVRIGEDGQVTSHGQLTDPRDPNPRDDYPDLYGLYDAPSAVPGVLAVSATVNRVSAPSALCPTPPPDVDPTLPVCKPSSDPHQPTGVDRLNQLAYYSNYGPRIDLAAPGGAHMFNLPGWDRGGSFGFPYTRVESTRTWGIFSATSNWGVDPNVPCFTDIGPGFPPGQCYTALTGTSLAAPHVAGVAALVAAREQVGGSVDALEHVLKRWAKPVRGNATGALSATDHAPGDLGTTPACASGYCHLSQTGIPDAEAYGAGLVDAMAAVTP